LPWLADAAKVGYELLMSRYIFNPPGWDRIIEFAAGWDPALETYFGQVMDCRDDGYAIVWVGAMPPHYSDPDDMMRAVNAGVAGILSIPGIAVPLPPLKLSNRVRARLMRDRDNHFKATGQCTHKPLLALDLLPLPAPPPPQFDEYGNRITDEVDFDWDDDDDEDEESEPQMAYPPLYVLRTVASCPQCRTFMHVFMLGCSAFCDAGWDDEVEDFFFLQDIESLPKPMLKLLTKHCPGYFLDREEPSGTPYLMNHCRCGAKLDTDYLHGDVGAAFWPDTPDGYGHFEMFLLPIDDPIPVECCMASGGGDYLDCDNAKPFAALSAAPRSGKQRKKTPA
jgi:hypothetical protein